MGEFDVFRGMTLVAGVNNAGDVSNGLSVRGGSLDQNLLLYECAPIFNPTHMFGLVSVFTPGALSSVDLYRANIPSRYGGRVASVLDVKAKNPYVDKFKLSGGIGLMSSRLTLESPIIKDRLMTFASFRAGFTDFLLPIFSERLKKTKAKFGDGTLKLLYLPSEKDQISFTGFYSKDFYQLDLVSSIENINAESNQYDFSIFNGTLKWLHSFNENASLKTVLVGSTYVPKIIGNSYGFGIYKNFDDNSIEMVLEGYYRDTENVLTYKPGADFFLEEFLEQDVVQGQGRAYGLELSFSKPDGNVNGWFNYTWSRSFLRSVNEEVGDRINDNEWFASDFDRPHVFNGTINFEKNKYNTVSLNFTCQTGRPYTVANGVVSFDEIEAPIFLERNNARLPVYHRLDFSWNIHFSKSKKKKRWQNDWTFTVYNLYGRKNPIDNFYSQRNNFKENFDVFGTSPLGSYELLVLNSPLFSLTYYFKFQ